MRLTCQSRTEAAKMLKVITKFFRFCSKENSDKFKLSIFFSLLQAIFEALKIPAIANMARSLINGKVTGKDILVSLAVMLVSIIGAGLVKARATMLQTEGGYFTCANKRIEIAQHMRYMPMGYFNENSLGQITSVATNVMQNLENVATRVIMLVTSGMLTTAVILVMIAFFDIRIAAVLLIGLLLYLLENRNLQSAASKMAGKKIDSDERVVEKVMEYVQGMAEVKAYRMTGEKSRQLNEAVNENVRVNTDMELLLIPHMSFQSFIAKLTGVAMVFFSCLFCINGTMDTLTAIVMTVSAFIIYTSLETRGNYSALLRVVDLSVDRAQAILAVPGMEIDGEDIEPKTRDLEADAIEFSYDKRKIIDGVSLRIPQKTTTAIVGPSGSGKTTLVNLLARFWDVDRGEVTLGGRNEKDYDMDSLMKNFSFVFQNVYLFRNTVANNIRFGKSDATMDEVIRAAKKACCHDFIMSLENGYDTMIGEGGRSLSGGEKQRISIARRMIKDAPIIFLDEATANVDPENENELIKAIEELTREKTVVMIAHRLKTVEKADNIIVLDNGRIVDSGTHAQLMDHSGLYRNFVSERKEAVSWKVKNA